MNKKLAAFVTSLALMATPAFAQDPAPVDPAATAVATDLLATMRVRETFATAMQDIQHSLPKEMRDMLAKELNSNVRRSAQHKKAVLERVEKTIPARVAAFRAIIADPVFLDEMFGKLVQVYVRRFTVAELREMLAFYRQPVGQKMVAAGPAMAAENMTILHEAFGPHLSVAMEQLKQAAKQ